MIPELIGEAANEGGWRIERLLEDSSGDVWIILERGDRSVHIRYTRWRHTTARAFRGNALSAILRGQLAVARYLSP